MPVALISTSTSPNLGPCRSTVSVGRGWPACQATAARVFMGGSGGGSSESRRVWWRTLPNSAALAEAGLEVPHNLAAAIARLAVGHLPGLWLRGAPPCRAFHFKLF